MPYDPERVDALHERALAHARSLVPVWEMQRDQFQKLHNEQSKKRNEYAGALEYHRSTHFAATFREEFLKVQWIHHFPLSERWKVGSSFEEHLLPLGDFFHFHIARAALPALHAYRGLFEALRMSKLASPHTTYAESHAQHAEYAESYARYRELAVLLGGAIRVRFALDKARFCEVANRCVCDHLRQVWFSSKGYRGELRFERLSFFKKMEEHQVWEALPRDAYETAALRAMRDLPASFLSPDMAPDETQRLDYTDVSLLRHPPIPFRTLVEEQQEDLPATSEVPGRKEHWVKRLLTGAHEPEPKPLEPSPAPPLRLKLLEKETGTAPHVIPAESGVRAFMESLEAGVRTEELGSRWPLGAVRYAFSEGARALSPEPKEVVPPPTSMPSGHWCVGGSTWSQWPWDAHYLALGLGSEPLPGQKLLVGHFADEFASPCLISREFLREHWYILGRTGGGKTSAGLTPLLIQLIRGTDEVGSNSPDRGQPPPVVVIDLRGDMSLFHTARVEAKKRGQRFNYFTTHSLKDTFAFDPIRELSEVLPAPLELADALLQALSLIHTDEYGAGYYTDVHVAILARAVDQLQALGRPVTWLSLERQIREEKQAALKDANHLLACLAPFRIEPLASRLERKAGHTDETVVDMGRIIENREVAYFYLPSERMEKASRQVGKLAALTLCHQAAARKDREGETRRVHCMIDEFHLVVARHLARMFQLARGAGVSLIAAHQDLQDLKLMHEDHRHVALQNTRVKQWFSALGQEDRDFIKEVSGEKKDWVPTYSWSEGTGSSLGVQQGTAESQGTSWTMSQSDGSSLTNSISGSGEGLVGPFDRHGSSWGVNSTRSQGLSQGGSSSQSTSRSVTRGENLTQGRSVSMTREIREGITSEDLRRIFARDLASIVFVTGDDKGAGFENRPRAVQTIYAMSPEEHEARDGGGWPELAAGARRPATRAPSALVDEATVKDGVALERAKLRQEHSKILLSIFARESFPKNAIDPEDGSDPKR